MLLVVGPAQAARQLQIWRDIVIGLAEPGIGIQHVRILAQEIIVPLIVETARSDWDRYTGTVAVAFGAQLRWHVGIWIVESARQAIRIVGNAGIHHGGV